MKKILILFFIFQLSFLQISEAADSKMKVVATMAGYGVVGGALLGTASLAFGASSRSIARGASLGLYAGLLFGSYVVLSYEMKKRGFGREKEDYYPDSRSPYEDSQGYNQLPSLESYNLAFTEIKKDQKTDPLFYMNLVNFNF